jgi:hypothetical protein
MTDYSSDYFLRPGRSGGRKKNGSSKTRTMCAVVAAVAVLIAMNSLDHLAMAPGDEPLAVAASGGGGADPGFSSIVPPANLATTGSGTGFVKRIAAALAEPSSPPEPSAPPEAARPVKAPASAQEPSSVQPPPAAVPAAVPRQPPAPVQTASSLQSPTTVRDPASVQAAAPEREQAAAGTSATSEQSASPEKPVESPAPVTASKAAAPAAALSERELTFKHGYRQRQAAMGRPVESVPAAKPNTPAAAKPKTAHAKPRRDRTPMQVYELPDGRKVVVRRPNRSYAAAQSEPQGGFGRFRAAENRADRSGFGGPFGQRRGSFW